MVIDHFVNFCCRNARAPKGYGHSGKQVFLHDEQPLNIRQPFDYHGSVALSCDDGGLSYIKSNPELRLKLIADRLFGLQV